MKKVISLILTVVVVLGFCIGITSISVTVRADTEFTVDDLFEATNTYNLKENVQKETGSTESGGSQGQNKYEEPQYSFKFDFSTKNANTTTIAPYVTVFTHG